MITLFSLELTDGRFLKLVQANSGAYKVLRVSRLKKTEVLGVFGTEHEAMHLYLKLRIKFRVKGEWNIQSLMKRALETKGLAPSCK